MFDAGFEGGAIGRVIVGDAIDVPRECARLSEELTRLEKQLGALEMKLANSGFTSKAPPDVVARERVKQTEWTEKTSALRAKLRALGC